MRLPILNNLGDQTIKAILYLREAPEFIKENKLWRGYLSIGWISKLSIFIAIFFSYTFITEIIELFTPTDTPEIAQLGITSLFNKLEHFADRLIFSGSMKYLILILLETIIFHFAVRTQEILSGVKRVLTVKDFIAAQIRMIKVAISAWALELIISAILMFVLKLFGLDLLSKVAFFIIQFYFLGLAFMDNYNEQNEKSIKESFIITYDHHIGASIIIGFVAYLFLLIPLFGIIVTPFICAIGATTYMHYEDKDKKTKVEVH